MPGALILTRADIQRVMATADWLAAAETAFRAAASGTAVSPPPMHIPTLRGGFHAKGASIALDRDYVAVKVNGNFPDNPAELGLPTVQGAILLADGSNGVLLAILDSVEVTLRRTAAASALAARLLAKPESPTLLICGCGEQGRAHAEVLGEVLPIDRVLLWDRDRHSAERLARELNAAAVDNLAAAALTADVIACCTSAREPFLSRGMVGPGTFIVAVGADNPDKSEIDPALMAAATVITDSTSQCAAFGDLHHAIAEGAMTEVDVHAELADLLVGTRPGRRSNEEIIVLDSTGTGLLDVSASALIFQRCLATKAGMPVRLAEIR